VAQDREEKGTAKFTTASPSVNPKTGKVNPSAPTVGTEGWGKAQDERRTLSNAEPTATHPGRVRLERPGPVEDDRAELSNRFDATQTSMDVTHGGRDHTYRCADAGNADCRWETSGYTEEEVMERAREHGQTEHGWSDWTDALRTRVRDVIRGRRAA